MVRAEFWKVSVTPIDYALIAVEGLELRGKAGCEKYLGKDRKL